jgi:hypothetical protein
MMCLVDGDDKICIGYLDLVPMRLGVDQRSSFYKEKASGMTGWGAKENSSACLHATHSIGLAFIWNCP